jgi:predicted ester cyclase
MTRSTTKHTLLSILIAVSACATGGAQTLKSELGKPDVLIVASGMPAEQRSMLTQTARTFYTFWNTNDAAQGKSVISPAFTDRDLPPGRPQGPTGPLFANAQFHKAVPDLHCQVLQQIVAGDRVVTNMRFTGHFTGVFGNIQGKGQQVDFVATDILRIEAGKITDNWHIEDNLTFQTQIGAVTKK